MDYLHRISPMGVDDEMPPYLTTELNWIDGREGLLQELKLIQEKYGDLEIGITISEDLTSVSYSVKNKEIK